MAFERNLGRVKGDKGAYLEPVPTYEADKVIINWRNSDGLIDGPLPAPLVIEPLYYIPNVDNNGNITWTTNKDENGIPPSGIIMPPSAVIKGPKGDQGRPGLNIIVVPDLYPSLTDPLEIIKTYLQDTSMEIEEGNIYMYGEVAFIYDAESDTLDSNNNPTYNNNAFFKIEKPVNLTNYYNKNEMDYVLTNYYTKTETDALLGNIVIMQQAIKDILDNGL